MWIFGLGFILGALLGSLVECLAERSLTSTSFFGRSYCPKCKKILKWYDLFPIFSYLILRGHCRSCATKIPLITLGIEFLMAILIGLLFYFKLPANFFTLPLDTLLLDLSNALFWTFVICILVIFVITDFRKGLIPDRISLPAIIITFIYLVLSTGYQVYLLYHALSSNPIGRYLLPPHSNYFMRHAVILAEPLSHGLVAMLVMILFFGGLIFLTRGRGMGGGDLKLAAFIGLALGFYNGILAVFLAFITGSIIGIGLLIFKKRHLGQTIPFGPFLSLGAILAIYWGEQILRIYFNVRVG